MTAAHRTKGFMKASAIARARLTAAINVGEGWCWDGGHPLRPGQPFDVSHIMSVQKMKELGVPESEWHLQSNLTSSCRTHNRSAGGSAGAKKKNQTARTKRGWLPW